MTRATIALYGLAAALTLGACSRDDLYGESNFTENVAQAYADCNDSEIRFLTAKHGIQLAFEPCGSNRFSYTSWSPNGLNLYFQLTHGGHILDAETGAIETVPTETPTGPGVWMRDSLLFVPLAPAAIEAGGTSAESVTRKAQESKATDYRIAQYNRTAKMLDVMQLNVRDPQDLQPLGDGEHLVFTALDDDDDRRPYSFNPSTGETLRILPFIEAPVARLVYTPEVGLLSWSDGADTELLRIEDGSSVMMLPGVQRAIPHPSGRYVALETLGEPISLFDQRSWNELSPEAREREQRRKERWLQNLPEWAPRDVKPPEIHILDLDNGKRFRVTAFYGDHFEWSRPRRYWCSFVMWGVEGKQLHRNVALTDLAERLRMADKGEIPMGLEIVTSGDATAPTTPGTEGTDL